MVLLLKLCLLSWCRYVSSAQTTLSVIRVFFTSLDFFSILHWETTCDGQPTCRYEVQYKVYGERTWQNKTDCESMKNMCNMTTETLKKEHVDEQIFARVRAIAENTNSSWKRSKGFQALQDTTISFPMVTVTPSSDTILVDITPPQLLYGIKYANTNYQKKTSFIIKMLAPSKLIKMENTEETKWNITNLAPGNYCITVNMMFGEITSLPSPNTCVEIKGIIINEVFMGSILAVIASVVIAALLGLYLILYRKVFHPKPPLPYNLILHSKKSKPCDHQSDEDVVVPPVFEGMDLSKHILGFDESVKEHPKVKRYVSTETCRKDYVNCRQKGINQSNADKMIELRNSTYGAMTFLVEDPNVWVTSQAKNTKVEMSPHHTHFWKGYYNDFITHGEHHTYRDQGNNVSHAYTNDP